ncbi:hypothetical protein K6119_10640 [Paracrocinitomix mangrovi]|uniref:hypothetical protein n=1 Tax=Paracrocinitomix mangrovi TaxID=2862509 RepID=UPI001C8E6DB9|nr:hypothetical protein [Paracrocinitomix mangrovi]UKN00189.1 hypothetical protein K6119_10640 [Paracrocinitomix mangrovi]
MQKKIPIAIRKILEEALSKHGDIFTIDIEEDKSVLLQDSDPNSDFYFKLLSKPVSNKPYSMTFRPFNDENFNATTAHGSLDNIKANIEMWAKLIRKYNQPSPIFDNEKIKFYYDDLEADFEILDDQDDRMLNRKELRQVVAFLDELETATENEAPELKNEVSKEIKEIKAQMSECSKSQLWTKIRTLFAKAYSKRFELGERFLLEFTSSFAVKLITG